MFLDLSQPDSLEDFAEQAKNLYGRVDILINNAGIGHRLAYAKQFKSDRSIFDSISRGTFLETNMEVHRKIMEVNFFAPLQLTKCRRWRLLETF